MKKLLNSKRVWIITFVFLMFAGVCYADYTMPDGTVVKWVSGNTLQVINPDGSSHLTTGRLSDTGRLVPVDNSVNQNVANQIPSQNSATQGGMNNLNMTVPIISNGQVTGYADVYGQGVAYQGNTAVRSSNETQGNTVDWVGVNNTYGGGVIYISTPSNPTPVPTPTATPLPLASHNPSTSPAGGNNGDSVPPYTPPYIPPAPYIVGITVSGSNSAIALQSYSYTATATYSNGNTMNVTSSASWVNGPTFTPQKEGSYTVSATVGGITGSRQVTVVLPPAATPPASPPVRLY